VNAAQLVQYITYLVFVVIFVPVLARAIRRPRRANVNAALFFGVVAGIIVVSATSRAVAVTNPVISGISAIALLGLPFLTLRLVDDILPVRRRVLQAIFAVWVLLVAAGIAVAVSGVALPREALVAIVLPILIYFGGTELYGGLVVFRAYRRAAGVMRPRLLAICLGTVFLGLAILVIGLALDPGLAPFTSVATNVLALASAVSYYVGFSTPGFLRRAWQEPLLRSFMVRAVRLAAGDDLPTIVGSLTRAAAQIASADVAAIGLWHEESGHLRYWASNGQTADVPPLESSAGPAFVEQRVLFRYEGDGEGPLPDLLTNAGLRSSLAAPITWGNTRYGALGAYSVRPPIFAEDELELVQILAGQVALIFRNNDLFSEVRTLNAELERRIGELDAANEELSSFSYAVSHDLRAPLRAIDGFSEVLLQDKAPALGDDGREHLARVRNAAQRMGELIDALLELSRMSRAELKRSPVDLSAMAREIHNDLERHSPDRTVACEVEDGLRAQADERLVRTVLQNVIGNAWKFTRPVKAACIQVGSVQHNGSPAFFVRDNGVGFDATYKQKLFTPFQRLHSMKDFEGTGVGLATVRRVVRRHGGETWAESEPGRGATFYFTLPSA
jgi:signal transduction histidine kinase